MSFLTAAQQATAILVKRRPPSFFSSSGEMESQICAIANDFIRDLVKGKDWRVLTKLQTMVGDGIVAGFDMPEDYDHMPKGMMVHNKDWLTWTYTPAKTLDEWLYYINGQPLPAPGAWIILGGQMQFSPPVAAGTTAQFYYISKNIVRNDQGVAQAEFSADSDTMLLDEKLLTLGLIWRWKAIDGLDYAEDLRNYEIYLSNISGDDKGSTIGVNAGGRWRAGMGIGLAYPWPLGV